jgi:NADPH:quinone reductase-like Zn-dependent oxidoreductase
MKAIKILSPGHAAVDDVPIPKLPSQEWALIRTVAVALNPTDWKHIEHLKVPAIVGCDFAGIVEEVGSDVTKELKKGDRVWGLVHGSNSLRLEGGSFGEYLISKGDLLMKIPDNMSFEEAASTGVAVLTVGQGMYQEMGLPWPDQPLKEKKKILIWGGSSSVGATGIQFAKLCVMNLFLSRFVLWVTD